MKKIITVIAFCLFITPVLTVGQSDRMDVTRPTIVLVDGTASPSQQPSGLGSGCQWLNVCAGGGICIFYASQAVGCDPITCVECFRGLLAQPTDPKATDLTTQFVGTFQPYSWRGQKRTRFVVLQPGPLEKEGVRAGFVVSKINGIRVTRKFLILAPTLKGASVTIYSPGKASTTTRTITRL